MESFDAKINTAISMVCKGVERRGVELHLDDDRLQAHSKKKKFLIRSKPDDRVSPS